MNNSTSATLRTSPRSRLLSAGRGLFGAFATSMFLLAAGCQTVDLEPPMTHAIAAPPESKAQGGEFAGSLDPVQPDSGTTLAYQGGKVMGATKINLIWYGTWSPADSTVQIVEDFAQHIGGSPYFNINTGYYDSAGGRVKNQVTFGSSVYLGHFLGDTLADIDIADIVQFAISNNFLAADPNAVYFVVTSADVDETSGFCTDFCAWHNHSSIASTDIKLSFLGSGAACPDKCEWGAAGWEGPNNNPEADAMVSAMVHELEETATDPDFDAWKNNGPTGENGDLCAWDPGETYTVALTRSANVHLGSRDYLIQTNWLNTPFGGCDHQRILTKPYAPVGSAAEDFNGDAAGDILWRNATTGETSLWTMFGLTPSSKVSLGTPSTAWDVYGVADFNNDKKSDILWYNQSTGQVSIWMMNGSTRTAVVNPVAGFSCGGLPPCGHQLEGVIDLNKDGFADILWRAPGDSKVWAWETNGTANAVLALLDTQAAPEWQIRATGDFDHDGNADILWQNTLNDDIAIWYLNGNKVLAGPLVHAGASDSEGPVTIRGVGDFNKDGTTDILWTGSASKAAHAWLMGANRTIQSTRVLGNIPSDDFRIDSTADFNGDGAADIVWRSRQTGEVRMWLVGPSAVNEQHIDTVTLPWQIEHN